VAGPPPARAGIPHGAVDPSRGDASARGDGRLLTTSGLPPALRAFDAVADRFDERFTPWQSVAAQRRAVRRELLATFPAGASLLELGGGTGEDALFLAAEGRRVLVTDGAPSMVDRTREKAAARGLSERVRAERVAIEELPGLARRRAAAGEPPFDGVFSNFAAFNCVADPAAAARALAPLVKPGAHALLVVFGPVSPGETLALLLRGERRAAFRRFARGPVPARLGGHEFTVTYPSRRSLARAFAPHFALRRTVGIGIFVPPSSAEPAISGWPRLLAALEALDRVAARPLAFLGDHVLLDFVRAPA
jgi:SAM-dependent methyltransferase